jgi:DNA-binding NtrC family response regulator
MIVDDEDSPRESLRFILKDRYDVIPCTSGAAAISTLRNDGPIDLVTLDMMLPDMDGLQVLSAIMRECPGTRVIMATAVSEARPAVEAMKMGAADYVTKPFDAEEIRLVVERVLKHRDLEHEVGRLRSELQGAYKFENIIGNSMAMQKMYGLIRRLIDTDTTVLIQGETGTGKELVARALHYNGSRKAAPFIPVHCAAIPGELLESELFGHEKGSFTGAMQRRIGMFEAAAGGTLFLDEIGEMPIETQSKLLRALQEREIRRVGGQETINVNVRLLCATNRDLEQEVKNGNFREDLFYRINVVPVVLPSLRERREDIPKLVLHFAQRFAGQLNREMPQFTPQALELFTNYDWPGNVRELEHAIERLLVICDSDRIGPEHLSFMIMHADSATAIASSNFATVSRDELGERMEFTDGTFDLTKATDAIEKKAILEALRRTDGVITEAARILNITRRMLRYKMDKFGIAPRSDQLGIESDELAANGMNS